MIDAVLFDLDDTIYPQAAWLDGAWRAVAAHAAENPGVDAAAFEVALRDIAAEGSDRGRIIDRALDRVGASEVSVPPLVDAFRAHAPTHLDSYPGARDALAALATRVPLAVVTDGDPVIQRAKLRALGVEALFGAVVISDELGRELRKPHAAPFLRAVELLAVAPDRAVVIGDRPAKDVAGAQAAGMRAVRVRTGEWAAEADAPSPWATVDTVVDAVAFVGTHLDRRGDDLGQSRTPTSSRKSTSPGTSR